MESPKKPTLALVTGVSRAQGLGYEVCRQLAAQSITVLLTARQAEQAKTLAHQLQQQGMAVEPFELDITQEASIQALAQSIESKFGKLDILINNAAGIAPYGEQAATADLAMAHQLLETTLLGSWRMCQAFLPLLRLSPQGRLVNVSSGAGSFGDTGFGLTTSNGMGTSYAVAKTALNALTVKLAQEEASASVLINAVCPGFTATFEGGEAMGLGR